MAQVKQSAIINRAPGHDRIIERRIESDLAVFSSIHLMLPRLLHSLQRTLLGPGCGELRSQEIYDREICSPHIGGGVGVKQRLAVDQCHPATRQQQKKERE